MTELPHFPGAVGFTNLRVYDSIASDGVRGGSPHVHLASAEAYIVTAGEGAVQTFGADGYQRFDLRPGVAVWFEPGIIHRLVNTSGDLEIFCVMQNAGLPEAGDAVLTFPDEILADPEAYAASVQVTGDIGDERLAAAERRRDLAVTGFEAMLDADNVERSVRYERFLQRAVALKRDCVPAWRQLWEERPLAEAHLTGMRLEMIAAGQIGMFTRARVASYSPPADVALGMCGRLDTYLPEGWR